MSLVTLLGVATLPFLAKISVMVLGLQGYVLQSLYKIFQLLIPILWRRQQEERGIRLVWPTDEPLPSGKIWVIGTLIAVSLSMAGIIGLHLLLPLWKIDPHIIRAGFDARFTVGPAAAVTVVAFLSFINSALEELHFRVWLDREVSRRVGNMRGIAVSAVAFASMHSLIFLGLPGVPYSLIAAAMLGLTICGICWSLLMRTPGGIHAAWWSHGLTDALLLGWGLQWLGYL